MRERCKTLNDISYSLTLQALTPALSRREREFTCFCNNLRRERGTKLFSPREKGWDEGSELNGLDYATHR